MKEKSTIPDTFPPPSLAAALARVGRIRAAADGLRHTSVHAQLLRHVDAVERSLKYLKDLLNVGALEARFGSLSEA